MTGPTEPSDTGSPALPAPARAGRAGDAEPRQAPWVELRTYSFAPTLYPAMLRRASPDARPGDLVTVYDKEGRRFGAGLYNPRARVPLRVLHHGADPFDEDALRRRLEEAVALRLDTLRLTEAGDAFRVVHSDGDRLSGLIVDRYADVLSVGVHSLGMWQRLPGWLPLLHARLGTRQAVVEVEDFVARVEGIPASAVGRRPAGGNSGLRTVKIQEHGVRFEVNVATGHKTGFFCDQRENRRQLAEWVRPGMRVLDLCCYTGGFALAAAVRGQAREVTGVDLDEAALAQARRNAHLNGVRINWVHCDAYSYARQMQRNGELWDLVVADPPKLVESREAFREGQQKYEDLNGLALRLLRPSGLLVTCSCSGLVSLDDFQHFVVRAGQRVGRSLQFLAVTGAGPDHPVMSNCPESRYLKVLWARVP